jgi:hypothetical protein
VGVLHSEKGELCGVTDLSGDNVARLNGHVVQRRTNSSSSYGSSVSTCDGNWRD